MSWLQAIEGATADELAYRLHLLGLGGGQTEVVTGYLRAEEQLRRAARVRMPALPGWTSVAEALSATEVSPADIPWFSRRRAAGEGRDAPAIAAASVALLPDWRPPLVEGAPAAGGTEGGSPVVGLLVSPALRTLPCLAPAGGVGHPAPVIACGPGMSPYLGLLGATAVFLVPALDARLPGVAHGTRWFAALMAAGTVLLARSPGDALVEALLMTVVREVLPPQHRADEVHAHVKALWRFLDQPPGEVERTMHGLGRRRADRLHRAWLRGFFVPRGLELERPTRVPHDEE